MSTNGDARHHALARRLDRAMTLETAEGPIELDDELRRVVTDALRPILEARLGGELDAGEPEISANGSVAPFDGRGDDDGTIVAPDSLLVFSEREPFVDCSGSRRTFDLTVRDVPETGFSGFAHEITAAPHGGYVFRAFASSSSLALARLRQTVRAGLAQRYLIRDGTHLDLPLERMCGRIDSDGLVVDGELIDWAALRQLLSEYEGWDFELDIPLERRR